MTQSALDFQNKKRLAETKAFHPRHPTTNMDMLKIATFNINGIRSRLPTLLEWLEREGPDMVCLQELKAPDTAFPMTEIQAAGYGAIWHGQESWNGVAILAKGMDPLEGRRGLPGSKADTHSRYLEAAVHGMIVGCLYLPNGNPQPGPKFDYKLAWFERLIKLRRRPLRKRPSSSACGRLQRRANRRRYLQPAFLVKGCAATTRKPRVLSAPACTGMDRFCARLLSKGPHLHLLGLFPSALAEGFGIAHRSSAA